MKVLVIGGTGFVGSALASKLEKLSSETVCVCRKKPNCFPGEVIQANRADIRRILDKIGGRTFDFTIDTCAMSEQDAELFLELQDISRKWLHISSGAVYSDTSRPIFDEESVAFGAAHWGKYGRNKAKLESRLLSVQNGKCELVVVRAPYIYGPGNSADREQFIWRHAAKDLPILVPQEPAYANFVHVNDFANALIAIGATDSHFLGNVVNFSSPRAMSLREFVHTCLSVYGPTKSSIRDVDNTAAGVAAREFFPFRTNSLVLSNSRFKSVFQTGEFETDFRQGLKSTLSTYSENTLLETGQTSEERFASALKQAKLKP